MEVYSNVFIHKETGDLLGYDLALKRDGDSKADALLYPIQGMGEQEQVRLKRVKKIRSCKKVMPPQSRVGEKLP